jgi:hypothetical protein
MKQPDRIVPGLPQQSTREHAPAGAWPRSGAIPARLRWRIEGALTAGSVAGCRARLLDELPLGRPFIFVLDLGRVDDFDAAGLQLLLSIARTPGASLRVDNPSRLLAPILSWTPIRTRWTLGASRDAACDSMPAYGGNRMDAPPAPADDWLIGVDTWHFSLRFDDEAFRAGVEPLAAVRALAGLGSVIHGAVVCDRVPALDRFDSGTCRLGFEIELRTDRDPADVARSIAALGAHVWVRAVAPAAGIEEYIRLIRLLPEGELRASRLLVASGALTPRELEAGLRAHGGDSRPA